MKKTKFLILLFALSLGSICIFAFSTYRAHKHVTFNETVLYGNPSVTKGLNATLKTNYSEQMYWNTNIKFSESIKTDTQYSFYTDSQLYEWQEPCEGLELTVDMSYSYDNYLRHKELLDSLETFELNGVTLYLKDFADYYDFDIFYGFPKYASKPRWLSCDDTATAYNPTDGTGYSIYQSDPEKADAWVLKNYFKIPVLETETYTEFFDENTGSHEITISDDSFALELLTVITDNVCYFTFNPYSTQGNPIDVSLLPDGFGIFALPYEPDGDENADTIRTDKLSVAYQLDPAVELYELQINEDQTHMFLYTIEDQQLYLTVIKIATMETLQKQVIYDLTESKTPAVHYSKGSILLTNPSNDTLSVYAEAENHMYHFEFTCSYDSEDDFFSRFDFIPQFDYNGEYLAFAGIDKMFRENNNEYCNFLIAIYDKNGLQYIGKYENSLDSGIDNDSSDYSLKSDHHDAIEISW